MSTKRDIIAISTISVLALVASLVFDFHDRLDSLLHGYEGWQADEILTVPLVLAVAFGAFFWRRSQALTREMDARAQLESELAYRASHDALTDLPNRVLFLDRIEHALARARRDRTHVGVLFIDLDDFKEINDFLGHGVGDALLTAAAARFKRAIREADTVSRFGGDEFGVLIEDLEHPDDALVAAERLYDSLALPLLVDGQEINGSASIGVVVSSPYTESGEELLRQADIALYSAKRAGKGRLASYEPHMALATETRRDNERELREAVSRGEFQLLYQPVVVLDSGEFCGVEALVRWQHPTRGELSPAEFLPLAEETGLIIQLGQWVLDEACRQAQHWNTVYPGAQALYVTVNLSARQFQHRMLIDDVAQALESSGLAPDLLVLEITETTMMADQDAAVVTLQALKSLGVHVAIDDFGMGYSSLAYLQRFPVDALKIDRAFTDGLGRNQHDQAIVRAILALADALSLETIAEGIEQPRQIRELRDLGCNLGQGYYYAKPLAPTAVDRLLRERAATAPVAVAS